MDRLDLPQGTLDLLILKALSLTPMHGWAISERIHQVSRATLQIPQGSLYPALHRLERSGLVASDVELAQGRRRRTYSLTAQGRKEFATQRRDWQRYANGMQAVIA